MDKPVYASFQSFRLWNWLINNRYLPLVLIGLVTAYQTLRLLRLIDNRSVNILYWDMWDFYTPLFDQSGLISSFFWQHGPHRQGIGGMLIYLLAGATGWNSNADVYAILILLFLASLAALWIKHKLFGRLDYFDAIIPVFFISVNHYEIYIGAPNIALVSFPVLLVVLLALAWLVQRPAIRYTLITLLAFLLIFTGFGIFGGVVATGLLVLESVQAWRRESRLAFYPLSALAFIAMGWALFLNKYNFAGGGCKLPSLGEIWRIPEFAALMYTRYFRLNFFSTNKVLTDTFGLTSLALVIGVVVTATWFLLTREQENRGQKVILILSGYSLVFGLYAGLGRYCLDLSGTSSGRYMPFLSSGLLGLYFFIRLKKWRWLRWSALPAFLLICAILVVPLRPAEVEVIDYFYWIKKEWKTCYLEKLDADVCNEETGFIMYPTDDEGNYRRMKEGLRFLEEQRLNLFLDAGDR